MAERPRRTAVASLGLLLTIGFLVGTGTPSASAGPSAERCKRPSHSFVPARAEIPAIGRTVKVIQVERESSGQIGAGPVTEAGKWLMSMDPKTKPGGRQGSILLSGHTWPDGSALGNAMLDNLWAGNGIVLYTGNTRACYRINKRESYPVDDVPRRIFRTTGYEEVVIVACSGKRLGPGNWTRRTLWYATPWVPEAPTPPSTPPPSNPTPPPCLLCGILKL
ncbi:class F sortase [Nocardioides marmorisolisilvae]|nr:class F sortase [Nocardioides marmorisolisilvae]